MNKRIVFIDYIRVVACFLVMLVHSSENFYCWTADTSMLANESNRLWVAIFDGAQVDYRNLKTHIRHVSDAHSIPQQYRPTLHA